MFDAYADTFAERGASYEAAMRAWPDARRAEFAAIVAAADLQPGHAVADVPSGGGYLAALLPIGARYTAVDAAASFLGAAPDALAWSQGASPVAPGSQDRVLSLAGLHHLPDRRPVFAAFFEMLRPGGRVVVADGAAGSPVARFLDDFVDRFVPGGHQGRWFDAGIADELAAVGFVDAQTELVPTPWRLADEASAVAFVRGLFGLRGASDAEIASALNEDLGAALSATSATIPWALQFAVARRP